MLDQMAACLAGYPRTRAQRCWVAQDGNVLNRLPRAHRPKAKEALQAIWMAPSREAAQGAFEAFVNSYGAKYPKVVELLEKDREELLAFYDFPAAKHLAHPVRCEGHVVDHALTQLRSGVMGRLPRGMNGYEGAPAHGSAGAHDTEYREPSGEKSRSS